MLPSLEWIWRMSREYYFGYRYRAYSWSCLYVTCRLVSKKMARHPLQDRVKSRRDTVFIKQIFIVFIPTLEVTHIVGKRIFKTFKTKNQEALIRIIIQAIEKCVHLSFAPSITRPHQDVRGYITKYVCKPSDCFLGSFQR